MKALSNSPGKHGFCVRDQEISSKRSFDLMEVCPQSLPPTDQGGLAQSPAPLTSSFCCGFAQWEVQQESMLRPKSLANTVGSEVLPAMDEVYV